MRTCKFSTLAILIFSCFLSIGQIDQKREDSLSQTYNQKKSARPVHWSYSGKNGPNKWGELSPVYALCSEGKNQSPINISKEKVEDGIHWDFDYKKSKLKISHNEHVDDIVDNGHTIQVSVEEGSIFKLNGKSYYLKQFHFHTPSEHTIDGKNFPMEVHFVHQSDSGDFAVIGVLVKEGKVNENLEKIVSNLPEKRGEFKHIEDENPALQFHLPKISDAYHYIGSLTTPPCSEGVEWLVFKNISEASRKQIAAVASKIGPNNRPKQKLNERKVKSDKLKGTAEN